MVESKGGLDPARFERLYSKLGFHYGLAQSARLASQRQRFCASLRALLPGDGEGRNAVWLVEQGVVVTTFDPSLSGVGKARRLAAERGVTIDAHVSTAQDWN